MIKDNLFNRINPYPLENLYPRRPDKLPIDLGEYFVEQVSQVKEFFANCYYIIKELEKDLIDVYIRLERMSELWISGGDSDNEDEKLFGKTEDMIPYIYLIETEEGISVFTSIILRAVRVINKIIWVCIRDQVKKLIISDI